MTPNSLFGSDSSWKTWNIDMVKEKLTNIGLAEIGDIFKEHKIAGNVLTRISDSYLKEMGISLVGDILQVKKFIDDVTISLAANRKVFNDPIHGHIELHPLCVKIIDTPQFQRLRFIRQLGLCYFVYPGASHNRFEHSLGVCHLAGKLVQTLRRRQPELNITDVDVLCVEIAGLCHDLGHGPFSHLFDGKFIPHMCPDKPWKHEEASKDMFKYILHENNLLPEFEKYRLGEQDITFIEEQVAGPIKNSRGWPYQGRAKEKSFLYEVVANKRNGIDVDKWDYFARDCHMLGIKNNFDHNRCMHFARVLEVDEELQICSRDKEVGNLYDMFHTRNTLHRRAYQHKTTNIIEAMVTEALVKANDHIEFAGKDMPLKMSKAIYDMKAFSQMTDNVFFQILYSTKPELAESREILGNILVRKLYKCVGQTQLKHNQVLKDSDVPKIKKVIFEKMDPAELPTPLKEDDIVVILVYLDYGMKDKNPIDSVRFYSKETPNIPIRVSKDQVSNLLPETFVEQQISIYCKITELNSLAAVKRAFSDWCKQCSYSQPKGGDVTAMELTPIKPPNTPKDSSNNSATPGSIGKFRSKLSF